MYCVYVLRDPIAQRFYIGYSSNLRKRLQMHVAHRVKTTKYAQYELIYIEAYRSKLDAVSREVFLKSGSGHRYLKRQLKHFLAEN